MNINDVILIIKSYHIYIILIQKGGKPLKTLIRILIIISSLLVIGLYFNFGTVPKDDILLNEVSTKPKVDYDLGETGTENTSILKMPNEGLISLMGKPSSTIINELGKPTRIDPSLYGYEWWVYPINNKKYIQAGIKDGVIVTIFATGSDIQISPFKIGQPVAELYSFTVFDTNISLEYNNSSYKFELSEDDLNTRPLIMIGNVYAQLYLDKFSSTLSSMLCLCCNKVN